MLKQIRTLECSNRQSTLNRYLKVVMLFTEFDSRLPNFTIGTSPADTGREYITLRYWFRFLWLKGKHVRKVINNEKALTYITSWLHINVMVSTNIKSFKLGIVCYKIR